MKIFFVFLFVTLSSPVVSGTVDTAQRYLNILGYDAGVVDGLYGSKTKRALAAFFADRGTKYDGTLDDAEIAALLDTGFLGEAAIKSGAHNPKEIYQQGLRCLTPNRVLIMYTQDQPRS